MKSLLLIIALFSFNVFAENPPPANSFKGTIYGYEVAIYTNTIFGTQVGLRAVYKNGDAWVYLAEPSVYESEINTREKADTQFARMIDEINAAAYTELNPISLEPSEGLGRLQWLLENKITVVDNQIVIN